MTSKIKRGDIFLASLDGNVGSEQGGIRPVVIIQNDKGNKYSSTVIALAITSKPKHVLPTHVLIRAGKFGLKEDSIILAEQIRTLDKARLIKRIGGLSDYYMSKIKSAIEISFGLRGKASINEILKIITSYD